MFYSVEDYRLCISTQYSNNSFVLLRNFNKIETNFLERIRKSSINVAILSR